MIKVIETNLSMNGDYIEDHHSRVIEVESWDEFVNEIKEGKTVMRYAVLGGMYGNTIPRSATVSDLKYDKNHLSCIVYNYARQKTMKLVCRI